MKAFALMLAGVVLALAGCGQGAAVPTPAPTPECEGEEWAVTEYLRAADVVLDDMSQVVNEETRLVERVLRDIEEGTPVPAVQAAYRREIDRATAGYGPIAARIRLMTPPPPAVQFHDALLQSVGILESTGALKRAAFAGDVQDLLRVPEEHDSLATAIARVAREDEALAGRCGLPYD